MAQNLSTLFLGTAAFAALVYAVRRRKPSEPQNESKLTETASRLEGYINGMMATNCLAIGHKLDLFTKLYEHVNPVTSDEFSRSTGLSERWIREWLGALAAAKVLDFYIDGTTVRYSLSEEGAMLLCPFLNAEGDPGYGEQSMIGLIQLCSGLGVRIPQITKSFKTGAGIPYDFMDQDSDIADGICELHTKSFTTGLVPQLFPHFDKQLGSEIELLNRLRNGAKIADVGCGGGLASIAFAKAFPNSQVHGFELSKRALSTARKNAKISGLENVHFHDVTVEPMDGTKHRGTFDFVFCFDLLHDTTNPTEILKIMKDSLKQTGNGAALVVDIEGCGCVSENVRQQSMIRWGISLMLCMPSGLNENGEGLGLGTHGLHSDLGKSFFVDAGFSHVAASAAAGEQFTGLTCYTAIA